MSNIYELPNHRDSNEEVSNWLARIDRGLTEQEEIELQEWLDADAGNVANLMEIANLWDRMDSMMRLADLFPEPISKGDNSYGLSLAMAASVLIAVLVGFWYSFDIIPADANRLPKVTHVAGEQIFETAIGEHSTITLTDGSQLILNTNSMIRVMYTEYQRKLMLDRGEVYIDVAEDKSRPLNVFVGDSIVQAVGTAFNLEINSDMQIELIVTEGKVLVGASESAEDTNQEKLAPRILRDSATSVSAGEQLTLGEAGEEVEQVNLEEVEVKLSWRGGNLVFRGESLAETLTEIERYTSIEFVILDEELKQIRVAGLFKAGDVDGLLTTLRENFNITYQRISDERVILTDKDSF